MDCAKRQMRTKNMFYPQLFANKCGFQNFPSFALNFNESECPTGADNLRFYVKHIVIMVNQTLYTQ